MILPYYVSMTDAGELCLFHAKALRSKENSLAALLLSAFA